MRVAVAFDHAGFSLKPVVLEAVEVAGDEVLDLGTDSPAPVDYPDFAEKLGCALQEKELIAAFWCAALAWGHASLPISLKESTPGFATIPILRTRAWNMMI